MPNDKKLTRLQNQFDRLVSDTPTISEMTEVFAALVQLLKEIKDTLSSEIKKEAENLSEKTKTELNDLESKTKDLISNIESRVLAHIEDVAQNTSSNLLSTSSELLKTVTDTTRNAAKETVSKIEEQYIKDIYTKLRELFAGIEAVKAMIPEMPQIPDISGLLARIITVENRASEVVFTDIFDRLKDVEKEIETLGSNSKSWADEIATLAKRTQLLLQISTQRTNTSTTSSTGGSGCGLTGNSGTTAGTNFIGTTDDTDFIIKTNSLTKLQVKSYGSSDIAELRIGSDTTADGRIYFRDGQAEYHRVDMQKSGSNMNVTRSTAASGTVTVLNQLVGDTAGYEDYQATAVRMRARTPLRFFDETNTNYVGLRAPADASISADVTFALPPTDAVRNGGAISSDKSGNLFFDYFARSLGANTADSSAVANTTTETLFGVTHTVSPSDINELGTTFIVFAQGRASTTGTPTLQIKLKGDFSSGTTLYDSGAQTMGAGVTDRPWMFLWVVTVRASGGSGQIHSSPIVNRIDARNSNNAKASAVVDLSLGCQFGISAQWSAASASNTTTLESFVVLSLNKR